MKIQKSNLNNIPTLFLVPTPIGNYDDMTYRAVETLKKVDYIYCEDTRVTYNLLSHFNIYTSLKSYHIFNEDVASTGIIEKLEEGLNVALVSDAGLPVISDPGFFVARSAIDKGYNVVSLPGANAGLTALIASGIPAESFMFIGFLDHKITQKEKQLKQLTDLKTTLIFYEAPHRIIETLNSIYKVMGNREICVAREISKKYEEYIRGNVLEIIEANLEFKGEIVVIVKQGDLSSIQVDLNNKTIIDHMDFYLKQNYSEKEAMKYVARDRKVSKSEVYKKYKEHK